MIDRHKDRTWIDLQYQPEPRVSNTILGAVYLAVSARSIIGVVTLAAMAALFTLVVLVITDIFISL